ncbi:MAG: hypothetical protein ACWIPH_01145, partial [Ostreibacterium sp.]
DFTTSFMCPVLTFFSTLPLAFSPHFHPTLSAVIIAVVSLLGALILRKKWLAIGFLAIFIPIKLPMTTEPSIILADNRYTSALFHNGKTAIIINPGRHYHQINQAKKWQYYLQQNNLTLLAIILSDNKLTHISATQWLAKQFPMAKIITLKNFPLPYAASYCQKIQVEHLVLVTHEINQQCQASLSWYGEHFTLFTDAKKDNAILAKSRLIWRGKRYNSQSLGAIQIIRSNDKATLNFLRQKKRLWRYPIEASNIQATK